MVPPLFDEPEEERTSPEKQDDFHLCVAFWHILHKKVGHSIVFCIFFQTAKQKLKMLSFLLNYIWLENS